MTHDDGWLRRTHSWTREGRRAIEAALPARYRGKGRPYRRMLETARIRVSVSGIRGKSSFTMMLYRALRERGLLSYAKQTGTDPISYIDGAPFPIDRKGNKVRLDETMWEMKKFYPYEAAVVENQALSEYCMRTFNKLYVRPHHLVLLNIRRDHQGDIHPTLPGLARCFGRSALEGCNVVSGEQSPELNAILRKYATRAGARFTDASVGEDEYVPGIESVSALDIVLGESVGEGLRVSERARLLKKLRDHFVWWRSSRPGLKWFHGAEINDVDSTAAILAHLERQEPGPVAFVAYFRADRRDRTASFVDFLEERLASGAAERAYLAGPGAANVARVLRRWRDRVHIVPDDPTTAASVVDRMAREVSCGRIMTIVNAVPPFPRAIARALQGGAAPSTSTSTAEPPHRSAAA